MEEIGLSGSSAREEEEEDDPNEDGYRRDFGDLGGKDRVEVE